MTPGQAPQNLSEDSLLAQSDTDVSLVWEQWARDRIEPIDDEE